MNDTIEKVVQAVLYEGYRLFPYRQDSLKNSQSWGLGSLLPKAWVDHYPYSDNYWLQSECLISGDEESIFSLSLRFLQKDGESYREQSQLIEAVPLKELLGTEKRERVEFALDSGIIVVVIVLRCETLEERVQRLTVRVCNESPCFESMQDIEREALMPWTLHSVQSVLQIKRGSFYSLIDPPARLSTYADECNNERSWPVLVGEPGQSDTVLSSPTILYDYPEIAPESPGDLFDGTEIDELLTLGILALTDDEKAALRKDNDRIRGLLERAEALSPEQMSALHGRLQRQAMARGNRSTASQGLGNWTLKDRSIGPGDRVRLRPKRRADILDMALEGKEATIVAIERNFEGEVFFAVTIDDDPGQDMGQLGQVGHRFFYSSEEIEWLAE